MAECLHGMEAAWCSICRNLPDPFAEPTTRRTADTTLGTPFAARYPGKCPCGTDFYPGDTIRADGAGGYLAPCCTEQTGDMT